jgi:hypothetical protein
VNPLLLCYPPRFSSTCGPFSSRRSTERSRHIDIQNFAIQEWRQHHGIKLAHILGVIKPANAQPKPIGWILHRRLVRRIMAHHGPSSFWSTSAVFHRILRTREQPAVVLHLYSMTTTLSLGEDVAAQNHDGSPWIVHYLNSCSPRRSWRR